MLGKRAQLERQQALELLRTCPGLRLAVVTGVGETPGAAAENRQQRPAEAWSSLGGLERSHWGKGRAAAAHDCVSGRLWSTGTGGGGCLPCGGFVPVNRGGSDLPSAGEIVRLGLPPVCVCGFVERAETTASRRPGRFCAAGKLFTLCAGL